MFFELDCHIHESNVLGLMSKLKLERFPSGQRGQTVNLLAAPSEVQILPSPPLLTARIKEKG